MILQPYDPRLQPQGAGGGVAHSEAAREQGGQYAGHLVRAEGVGDEDSVAGHEG